MNNLPVIEVEEIDVKPKTQWELRLEAEISKRSKDTWFAAKQKPKKSNLNNDGTIPWDNL